MCQLPAPKDISDEELLKLLEAEDPSGFRIPMSLGEPHAELDKGTARQTDVHNNYYFANCQTVAKMYGHWITFCRP